MDRKDDFPERRQIHIEYCCPVGVCTYRGTEQDVYSHLEAVHGTLLDGLESVDQAALYAKACMPVVDSSVSSTGIEQTATEAIMAALRGDLESLYRVVRALSSDDRIILSVAADRLLHACDG
jgi:hypothetical protein